MRNRTFKYFLIILLLIGHLALLKRIGLIEVIFYGSRRLMDFDNYYRMAKDLLTGQHPYRLDYPQTLGPPLVLVIYLPFALFPLNQARIFITIANLFSAYLLSYLLAKKFFINQKWLVSLTLNLLLLSSFPARFNLLMGQPNLLIALLLTIFLTTNQPCLQGACLAIATAIKSFLGFSLLSLLKKNTKALKWFFIFLLGIMLVFFFVIKPSYYLDFFKERFFKTTFSPTHPHNLDYYNQSLKSTLFRLGIGESYSFIYPLFLISAGSYLFSSANLEAGVVLALLISPVCWQYYFVMTFPITIKLFKKIIFKPKLFALLGLSFALWWGEMPWLHQVPINFLNGLFASHYFLSALILLLLIIWEKETAPQTPPSFWQKFKKLLTNFKKLLS